MTYGVQLVRDNELVDGVEWVLVEQPDRLVLLVAASCFCASVVADGMAAVGDLMARRTRAELVPV